MFNWGFSCSFHEAGRSVKCCQIRGHGMICLNENICWRFHCYEMGHSMVYRKGKPQKDAQWRFSGMQKKKLRNFPHLQHFVRIFDELALCSKKSNKKEQWNEVSTVDWIECCSNHSVLRNAIKMRMSNYSMSMEAFWRQFRQRLLNCLGKTVLPRSKCI